MSLCSVTFVISKARAWSILFESLHPTTKIYPSVSKTKANKRVLFPWSSQKQPTRKHHESQY